MINEEIVIGGTMAATLLPHCPQCGKNLEADFDSYFLNGIVSCSANCGKTDIDLWVAYRTMFHFDSNSLMFGIVGGRVHRRQFTVKPGGFHQVSYSQLDIPEDAIILDYTVEGLGADHFPIMKLDLAPARLIQYYSIDFANKGDDAKVLVYISIIWTERSKSDFSFLNLVQALDMFKLKRYTETILPANVAVELKLQQALEPVFHRYAPKDKVNHLLTPTNGLIHHSAMFNVMLPLAANLIGFPELPKGVVEQMELLNSNRNEVAHRGKAKQKFLDDPKEKSADFICASFFTIAYLQSMGKHFDSLPRKNRSR